MKQVVILVPDCEVNFNSVAGAFEILSRASGFWQKSGNASRMSIHVAGFEGEKKVAGDYFSIHPTPLGRIKKADLVIIPSVLGDYRQAVEDNTKLLSWIVCQYKGGAEIASMCSGAFLLAATGLVEGRTCSTHWNAAAEFGQMFPEVKIASDKIITDENGIYTNGGAYSFLNLLLYLIEKYFDRPTAIYCSKIFQIDIERTSQSPYSIFHIQKAHGDELIKKAQQYIEEHIDEKISFQKLSLKLAISRRNFDRRFIRATGNTPVEYLQRVKMEVAKKELEKGRKTVFEVMNEVGYADDKAFREVFKKTTGISPMDYRNKYSSHHFAAN